MNTKFVIFGVISALLIAAIYVSSISYASTAQYRCVSSTDKKTTFCYVEGTEPFTVALCTKDKKGDWKCNAYDQTRISSYIPADLKDALDAAIQGTQNDTIGPKTDLLPDGDLPPLTSDDNDTKVPKDLDNLNDLPTINPGE